MNKRHAGLLIIGLGISGCTTVQEDVRDNREASIADCVKRVEISQEKFKDRAAAYIGVSGERMPRVFCERMAAGVASGKINQSDINNLIATGQLTAKFRFLKR